MMTRMTQLFNHMATDITGATGDKYIAHDSVEAPKIYRLCSNPSNHGVLRRSISVAKRL